MTTLPTMRFRTKQELEGSVRGLNAERARQSDISQCFDFTAFFVRAWRFGTGEMYTDVGAPYVLVQKERHKAPRSRLSTLSARATCLYKPSVTKRHARAISGSCGHLNRERRKCDDVRKANSIRRPLSCERGRNEGHRKA